MKLKTIVLSLNLFILLALAGCSSPKTYIVKYEVHEDILLGVVPKQVLSDPKKYTWFNWGIDNYKPNPIHIESLKKVQTEMSVLVVAGSWCSDTQLELPRFYKIANQLHLNDSQVQVLMVNHKKESNTLSMPVIQVKSIPAFIFYKNGKEVGRIIEKPDSTIEYNMMKIFNLM